MFATDCAMQLVRRLKVLALVSTAAFVLPLFATAQQAPTPGRAATPAATPQTAAPSHTRAGSQAWGIAVKRPVLQAACRYCPWGALADVVKKMMAPYGYDVGVCHTCSGGDALRVVARREVSVEVSDRQYAEGTQPGPDAPMDFGVTMISGVRDAYLGKLKDLPEGKDLRLIARIEWPSYWMIAVTKESGLTDLKQIRERKMPVRLMGGNPAIQEYYGITEKEVVALGGKVLVGNAMLKNTNFDVMIGRGTIANYPEGNMWYEMTIKKDLIFLPIPEEVRQRAVKEDPFTQLVDLPFRYMRGVGDTPIASVGASGMAVYGRVDMPDQFVYDVAKAIDEQHGMLKWANLPLSFDPVTVADGAGIALHPAAARYYREHGYLK
jgi:uncharacterized protein